MFLMFLLWQTLSFKNKHVKLPTQLYWFIYFRIFCHFWKKKEDQHHDKNINWFLREFCEYTISCESWMIFLQNGICKMILLYKICFSENIKVTLKTDTFLTTSWHITNSHVTHRKCWSFIFPMKTKTEIKSQSPHAIIIPKIIFVLT